jgi:hypothetical protein
MHVEFIVFGSAEEERSEIIQSSEGGLDFYRSHSPLNITSEWFLSRKILPPSVYPDLLFDKMGEIWNEISPQPVIVAALWRCTNNSQYTAWGWTDSPKITPQNYQTIFISLPYGYPTDPRDGRTSWNPAYGEGFKNNFQACLVHEMAHAIRNMGILTSPPIYNSITDIHDTNNNLSRINRSVNSVDKTLYFLSQIRADYFGLINAVPNIIQTVIQTVLITSVTPSDAAIRVNGISLSNNTTHRFDIGTQHWEVSRPGFITQSGEIVLTFPAVSYLRISLQPVNNP